MSHLFVLISTPDSEVDVLVKDAVEGVYLYSQEAITVYSSERLIADGLFSNLKEEVEVESYGLEGTSLALANEKQDALLVWDYQDDVIDFFESLAKYLPQSEFDLGSISTLVDCKRTDQFPVLKKWYDACIHFTDTVILGNRSELSNLWIKDFEGEYQKKCYPCLFVLQKKGKLSNPAILFDLQARRMSLAFDDLEELPAKDWRSQVPEGTIIFDEGDDEEVEFDEEEADEEEIEQDPYFVTHVNGKREIYVPEIRKLFEE